MFAGSFSCIVLTIEFQRLMGVYIINTYIPTIMSVMMSWVAFWIDPMAVPARTGIGMITVLTVTTQAAMAMSKLPQGESSSCC